MKKLYFVLFVFVLLALAPVALASGNAQDVPISDRTLMEVLAFIFSPVGIAVLLQRIPGWDKVNPEVKKVIVLALSMAAPGALAAVQVYVPPQYLNSTLWAIGLGLVTTALAFVFHTIDEWLTAQKDAAKRLAA